MGGIRGWFRERRAGAAALTEVLERQREVARTEVPGRERDEHLLLASCDHSDGRAAAALATVGVDRAALLAAILATRHDPPGATGAEPDDDRSLLRRTHDLSRDHLGGGAFVSSLVVAAAAEVDHDAVGRAIDRLGVDRAALHRTALELAGA